MIARFSKEFGWQFIHETLSIIPEFHNLMMTKEGEKKMKIIFDCYHIFSPYGDIETEEELEKKVCIEVFGEYRIKMMEEPVFLAAKKVYKEMQFDIDVEQYRNVEYAVSALIKQRDNIFPKDKEEEITLEDLEKIEKITKSLKLLYDEKEMLLEAISSRVKKGDFSKGKIIGGKKMSWLMAKNSSHAN